MVVVVAIVGMVVVVAIMVVVVVVAVMVVVVLVHEPHVTGHALCHTLIWSAMAAMSPASGCDRRLATALVSHWEKPTASISCTPRNALRPAAHSGPSM